MSNAYLQGFVTKCAEHGVTPEALVKTAARGDMIRKLTNLLDIPESGYGTPLHPAGVSGNPYIQELLDALSRGLPRGAEDVPDIAKTVRAMKRRTTMMRPPSRYERYLDRFIESPSPKRRRLKLTPYQERFAE
jgi:hypothetical protein